MSVLFVSPNTEWRNMPALLLGLALLGFGGLQMAVPYVLLARGLRSVGSQEAMGILLLEPVLTPFWAFAARGETPAAWTVAGATLILVGLVLRYFVMSLLDSKSGAEQISP